MRQLSAIQNPSIVFSEVVSILELQMGKSDMQAIAIYDGDCPFCANIIMRTEIERKFPKLVCVNARNIPGLYQMLLDHKIDLDKTMLYLSPQQIYIGDRALGFLLDNSLHLGYTDHTLSRLLRVPYVSRIIYLFLSLGRLVTLRLLGRKTFRSNSNLT